MLVGDGVGDGDVLGRGRGVQAARTEVPSAPAAAMRKVLRLMDVVGLRWSPGRPPPEHANAISTYCTRLNEPPGT